MPVQSRTCAVEIDLWTSVARAAVLCAFICARAIACNISHGRCVVYGRFEKVENSNDRAADEGNNESHSRCGYERFLGWDGLYFRNCRFPLDHLNL